MLHHIGVGRMGNVYFLGIKLFAQIDKFKKIQMVGEWDKFVNRSRPAGTAVRCPARGVGYRLAANVSGKALAEGMAAGHQNGLPAGAGIITFIMTHMESGLLIDFAELIAVFLKLDRMAEWRQHLHYFLCFAQAVG